MKPKELLKKIPGATALNRLLKNAGPKVDDYTDLNHRSVEELLSIMRHESHRIEKACYNNLLVCKASQYETRHARLKAIYAILEKRGYSISEDPTVAWSKKICDCFSELEKDFIEPNRGTPQPFQPEQAEPFTAFLRGRRSVRVWAEEQPPVEVLEAFALQMIDAARWAPNSGNRQPWRFRIITDPAEKELLRGIKEDHCIRSPVLIFIGMDRRCYGALAPNETCLYIDAGTAINQMVLMAHRCGMGTCWNHFAEDLVLSRKTNVAIYERFAGQLRIPAFVAPVAILSVGVPKFLPPEPGRSPRKFLMIGADQVTERKSGCA